MGSTGNSFNPNKLLKEQFVSNLTGSSMFELCALFTAFPVLILLRHSFSFHCKIDLYTPETSLKKNDNAIVCSKSGRLYAAMITMDFLCLMLPYLLCVTVLAEWIYECVILLMLLLVFFIASRKYGYSCNVEDGSCSLRTVISSYRVAVMTLTCLCIMAVDFKIFPRRYAKTETYGTSLMDVGVGLFVLTNSLVSRQARGFSTMKLKSALQTTSPLIILGFARLVTTTSVDYQVHVGEYGVHWNFFFTLAAVSILTTIFNIETQYCGILGSLILVGYQVCLMLGLNIYILSNERGTDIISQNKEGIFSIFGYWGMYLVGVRLGNYLFFGSHSNATLRTYKWAMIRVWILSLSFWLLTMFLDKYVERVSRRLCNLAYVTLVLALSFQTLSMATLFIYMGGPKISALEDAFNRNLLGSFLLANILTGMVNLCFDTLSASPFSALAILVGYAFTLSAIVGLATFYHVKLKIW